MSPSQADPLKRLRSMPNGSSRRWRLTAISALHLLKYARNPTSRMPTIWARILKFCSLMMSMALCLVAVGTNLKDANSKCKLLSSIRRESFSRNHSVISISKLYYPIIYTNMKKKYRIKMVKRKSVYAFEVQKRASAKFSFARPGMSLTGSQYLER